MGLSLNTGVSSHLFAGVSFDSGASFVDSWNPSLSAGGSFPQLWLRADSNVATSGARQFYVADKGYFSIADNASLSVTTQDFTLAAWVYLDASAGSQGIISKGGSGVNGYSLYLASLTTNADIKTPAGSTISFTGPSITAAGWYYLIAEYDRDGNGTLYVNNVAGTPVSIAANAGTIDEANPFALGAFSNGALFFGGRLSRAAKWDRLLTAAEKTWLYNSGKGRFYGELGVAGTDGSALLTSLQAYWNLNEGDATDNAIDAHSTNDLTPTFVELLSNTGFETVTQTYGARQYNSASSRHHLGTDNATLETGDIDFWLAGWAYLDSKAATQVILSKYDTGANQREYEIAYNQTADRFVFNVSNDGTAVVTATANTLGAPSTATWYFIMAYHDAVSDTINISVNGGAFDSTAHATGVFTGTAIFEIGAEQNSAAAATFMDGRLTRLAIGKSPGAGIAGLATTIRDALYVSGRGMMYGGLSTTQKTDWGLVEYWNADETTSANLTGDHAAINLTNTNTVGVADDMGPRVDFGTWAEGLINNQTWNDETSIVQAGSHAAKALSNSTDVNTHLLSQASICTSGHRYTGTAYMRLGAAGSVIVGLQGIASASGGATVNTTSYAQYSQTSTATGTTFYISKTGGFEGTLYVDTVSCKAVDLPAVAGPLDMLALDSSGNSRTGTLTNMDVAMAWSSDVPTVFNGAGYSIATDGSDDYVSIPDFAHSLTTLSCFCWVKTSAVNLKVIFAHDDPTGNQRSWAMRMSNVNTNKLQVILFENGSAIAKNYESSITVSDGTWHHVGFTYNVNTLKLYIDGVEDTSVSKITDTAISAVHNSTSVITVGSQISGGSPINLIAANIKDCRIYDEEVSAANIATIKANGTYTTNLVGHWKFDDGPQSAIITDQDPVVCWESKEGDRYQFCQSTASKRPIYVASAINSKPGILFDGTDDLLSYIGDFLTGEVGTIIVVYRLTAATNSYQTVFSTNDESVATRYVAVFGRGNTANNHLNYSQRDNDTTDILDGDTAINVDTNYCAVVQSDGSTITARVNGTAQTLNADTGANNGDWYDACSDFDNVSIGGQKRSADANWMTGYIAEVICYPTNISAGTITSTISPYILSRYGVNA